MAKKWSAFTEKATVQNTDYIMGLNPNAISNEDKDVKIPSNSIVDYVNANPRRPFGVLQQAIASDFQITNPAYQLYEIGAVSPSLKLILPTINEANSLKVGDCLVVRHTGGQTYGIYNSVGTPIVPEFLVGQTCFLWLDGTGIPIAGQWTRALIRASTPEYSILNTNLVMSGALSGDLNSTFVKFGNFVMFSFANLTGTSAGGSKITGTIPEGYRPFFFSKNFLIRGVDGGVDSELTMIINADGSFSIGVGINDANFSAGTATIQPSGVCYNTL